MLFLWNYHSVCPTLKKRLPLRISLLPSTTPRQLYGLRMPKNSLAKLCKARTQEQQLSSSAPPPQANTTPTPTEIPSPFLSAQPMSSQELLHFQGLLQYEQITPKEGPAAGLYTLPTIPRADENLTSELIHLLSAQHSSTVNSLADRQALAANRRATQECLSHCEQALL